MMSDYPSPAHDAVEHARLDQLVDLLAAGADVEEMRDGLSLLAHAVDTEADAVLQNGGELSVELTAAVLAAGADPLRNTGGWRQESARDLAVRMGHTLAVELFDAWIRDHAQH
jgi:hypothetical protein